MTTSHIRREAAPVSDPARLEFAAVYREDVRRLVLATDEFADLAERMDAQRDGPR